MAEITAATVKELRDRTGIGMSKCKKALEEAGGEMELAIENLRKSGEAQAVKKEGRTAKEGVIAHAEADDVLALVEINAETDFVINNDRFQTFVADMAEEAVSTKPASLEAFLEQTYSKDQSMTIEQYRTSLVQAIGENIQIRRVKVFDKGADKSLGVYSHLGGKIVVVVEISGAADQQAFAKDIAMHVAAAAPEYLSPDAIPETVISKEKEIARSQVEGKKPDNIIDKIVDGKMNNFYKTACLLHQQYIRDEDVTITQLVEKKANETGKTLTVTDFERWAVGQSQ